MVQGHVRVGTLATSVTTSRHRMEEASTLVLSMEVTLDLRTRPIQNAILAMRSIRSGWYTRCRRPSVALHAPGLAETEPPVSLAHAGDVEAAIGDVGT